MAGKKSKRPKKPKKPQKPQKSEKSAKRGNLLQYLFAGGILTTLFGALVLLYFLHDLPSLSGDLAMERRPAVIILDADDRPAARTGDYVGDILPVEALPPRLIEAVLAIEDRRFFLHYGIDPIGLGRAAWTNLMAGGVVQGGSTITQQLAKILFLTPERTLKRKVQEALLALRLEWRFSKNEILSAYLNRVYLGAGTYGVDAAARTYFGKSASALSLPEAAIIAGLLKAPSRLAPNRNPVAARDRAKVVIGAMRDAGYLEADQAERAIAVLDVPPPPRKPGRGDSVHYFADMVRAEARALLGAREAQDLIVYTTLDEAVQRAAETALDRGISGEGRRLGASQGAVVVMSRRGAIRAIVGGPNYAASQFNRATQARRQPGSAFKPIVYLAALQAGLTAQSQLPDAPINIDGWQPGNFDGEFRGAMTLSEALALSVNTVAVRTLERAGVARTVNLARLLGIDSPLAADLSLALGSSAVTPLELTTAYAVFANGGTPVLPFAIRRIEDRNGRVLFARQGSGLPPVIDPRHQAQLNSMLVGVVESGTGRAAGLDRPAAGKTGTSQDYRDAWFVGFTSALVATVWLGNDDNTPMRRVTGGTLPARIWRETMQAAHIDQPVGQIALLGRQVSPPPVIVGDTAPEGPVIGNNDSPQEESDRGGLFGRIGRFLDRLGGG